MQKVAEKPSKPTEKAPLASADPVSEIQVSLLEEYYPIMKYVIFEATHDLWSCFSNFWDVFLIFIFLLITAYSKVVMSVNSRNTSVRNSSDPAVI